MHTTIKFSLLNLILIAMLLFTACSKSESSEKAESSAAEVVQASNTEFKEIDWMDLMPEGEDEVLEKLYADYYSNLQKQIAESGEQAGDGTQEGSNFDLGNIAEGAANDTMEQIGSFNVVESLDGENIRIPGYVVPLDFNAQSAYTEFLLVPYFGACLHTPPPPPNQIVFVNSASPAEVANIYEPVWLEGTLKTGQFNSDLANTAYELSLSKIEPYVY